MDSTIEITGCFSVKAQTTDGMDTVCTNAELINGKKDGHNTGSVFM